MVDNKLLWLKAYSHLMSAFVFASTSLSQFNIVSIVTQTQIQTQNGSEPNLCITLCIAIDTKLNFDSDVDTNTNVKCEPSMK